MKKIILSAAVAAMAFSTSAIAADKGIDITVGGQATVYYETHDGNLAGTNTSLFDQADSVANVGVQLDLGADLGNNFTFGSQLTYLGAAGLEKDTVGNVKQSAGSAVNGATTDELALTKIFIAKQVANTTVKLGRQELPKSLSPLAFSEGWNVYKNTFDAIVAINTDLPKTTLVGAYVSGGTGMTLGTTSNLVVANDTVSGAELNGAAYMITASTTLVPMATITASYYSLSDIVDPAVAAHQTIDATTGVATAVAATAATGYEGADAYWLNVAIADKGLPMGLNVGLQAGKISPDSAAFDDTTAYGAKISLSPMEKVSLSAAFTDVDGNENKANASIQNTGTGIKTPLFTQMVYNQNAISLDAETLVLKAGYNMGDMGSISVAYGMTDGGNDNNMMGTRTTGGVDYNELDVVYKLKAGGVQYFAAYVNHDIDAGGSMNTTTGSAGTDDDIIRIWARLNF